MIKFCIESTRQRKRAFRFYILLLLSTDGRKLLNRKAFFRSAQTTGAIQCVRRDRAKDEYGAPLPFELGLKWCKKIKFQLSGMIDDLTRTIAATSPASGMQRQSIIQLSIGLSTSAKALFPTDYGDV